MYHITMMKISVSKLIFKLSHFFLGVFFILFTFLSKSQDLPDLGGEEGSELSPIVEHQLGKRIMLDLRKDSLYLDDLVVIDYLNYLGGILLNSIDEGSNELNYQYFFFAMKDSSINAFALPGGFIGSNTGLIISAKTESELASVLAHEISHVEQRHIARMLSNRGRNSLLPIAGLILAAIAGQTSPDLAKAALMGSSGLAAQNQLNFGRNAEREADRLGLKILLQSGFEPKGMINFFGRLQKATRNRSNKLPSYLRTHPLTTERISDIEARIRNYPETKIKDSLDFEFIKSRLLVLQNDSFQSIKNSEIFFYQQLNEGNLSKKLAAKYGISLISYARNDFSKAFNLINDILEQVEKNSLQFKTTILQSFIIELMIAKKNYVQALKTVEDIKKEFPYSKSISRLYFDSLVKNEKKK